MVSPSSVPDDFELIDRQEASLDPEELVRIQKWLQPTDYMAESSEFHRHLSSQAPGTGLWVCDTPRFRQWRDSEQHGSLWIKGVPGAGKSVTAASIIQHLKATENVPILFFFFRYIVVANRKPRSLIRDWLAQLVPHSTRLQATLQPLLEDELELLSNEQLWEYLLAGLSSIEKAYCVIDAMDEMEQVPNDKFLRQLNSLATFRSGAIKLLMTSRPKQYLQSALRDASIVHISLEQDLVGKDIAAFVSYRLQNVLVGEMLQEVRATLESTICARSQGLFLYARLLLDQIIPTISAKDLDVERLTSTLPIGLEDMYNSMLFQQSKSLNIDTSIQVFLLQCATHSSRPLRLNELANLLEFVFPPSILLGTPKDIVRTACAPLLEILEDETVQVIHHSFTEFLIDTERIKVDNGENNHQFPVLNPQNVHKSLAINCLSYLQSGVLGPRELSTAEKDSIKNACKCDRNIAYSGRCTCFRGKPGLYNYQAARLHNPFLEYSITNWAHHASHYDAEDEDFFGDINKFTDPDNAVFWRWVSLEWITDEPKRFSTAELPSPLHVAAFSGLTRYANNCIQEGQSVESLDDDCKTPLHWACRKGHVEMVSLLLRHGANTGAEDCRGCQPFHEAAQRNYAGILKVLLDAGVDPLTPKTRENHSGTPLGVVLIAKGETAVGYIVRQGHIESLLAILQYLQLKIKKEILCDSCRYGKPELLQALLANSDLSANEVSCGASALYIACDARSTKCVELLLAKGADVNLFSEWEQRHFMGLTRQREKAGTPLHKIASGWTDQNHATSHQIFRLLLRGGADLESKDGDGNTPLLNQFQPGIAPSRKAVKAILEAGANISAGHHDDDTVLHRFLRCSTDLEFLDLLFQHGANIEDRGKGGKTVLHTALSSSNTARGPNSVNEIMDFLIRRGARCDLKDDSGYTVLEDAVRNPECSFELFKLLLHSCPDSEARSRSISKVTRSSQLEAVQFIQELMSVGVSLETRDRSGLTPLIANVKHGSTFEALLKCGAEVNAVDMKGQGVLHHFIRTPGVYRSIERLQELIEKGLDPLQVDNYGNNLLHIAALPYRGTDSDVEFMQQLIDYGISINAKNNYGLTPLHLHIERGRAAPPYNLKTHTRLLELFQRQAKREKLDINAQDEEGLTPLHCAALHSEVRVARVLAAGADASILTTNGRSMLHLACRARRSDVVAYLLSEPANHWMIDKADAFGRTPLHDACTSGRPESVYYLLKSGSSINIKDSIGRTPLHSCAEFAEESSIWSLLQHGDNVRGSLRNDRYRPVAKHDINGPWYYSKWNNLPPVTNHETAHISGIIRSLVQAGADVTAVDSHRLTPLDLALAYNCQEMIKSLQSTISELQKRHDMAPENFKLSTEVALKQKLAVSCLFLTKQSFQEILQHPARYLSLLDHDDVEWIMNNGGDVNGTGNDFPETSLLHVVARRGLIEIMERLGHRAKFFDDADSVRAVIKASKRQRFYAESVIPILQYACDRELPNLEMLECLVDTCGVDVNARALVEPGQWLEGPTALHCLAEANYRWQIDAIDLLVKRGASIESRNEKGETPLHIASAGNKPSSTRIECGFWKPKCVELLLDLGADPNALDKNGLSCLHKASACPEVVKMLLERGADLHAGKTSPLFSAIQSVNLQALTVMLDAGISPDSVDSARARPVQHKVTDQARLALFCACFPDPCANRIKDSVPLIKLLIERGADIYAPLNDRETLIHFVFEHAEYEIVCAFMSYAKNIDFDSRDQVGRTVLLAAFSHNSCLPRYAPGLGPAIQVLEHKANFLAVDDDGRTALHHLLDNYNPRIELSSILEFLERDASKALLLQKDRQGFTPLHCALRLLRPKVCEALVAMGANLLEPDPNGSTALHQIASQLLRVYERQVFGRRREHTPDYYEGLLRLWQKYQQLGGDINVRNNYKVPALFSYLSSPVKENCWEKDEQTCCHMESFEKYFATADVKLRNADGETALHLIARREGNYHINSEHDRKLFEFMVAKGLDPLAEDNRGRSSLDVAAACGKKEILDLFQYRS